MLTPETKATRDEIGFQYGDPRPRSRSATRIIADLTFDPDGSYFSDDDLVRRLAAVPFDDHSKSA